MKIGELNQGDMVKRISTSDTGWSKITYNNETAYVSSTYLSTDPISFEGYECSIKNIFNIFSFISYVIFMFPSTLFSLFIKSSIFILISS